MGQRRSLVISTVCAAALVKTSSDGERFEDVRLALGGIGPVPVRLRDIENVLNGGPVGDDQIGSVSFMTDGLINSRTRRNYRVTFGLLTFMHGIGKIANIEGFAGKWNLSVPVAWLVCAIQTVGGVLIFVGLYTQIASLVQLALNVVILFLLIVRKKEPFLAPGQHSWSIGFIYVVLALVVVLGGNGAWAVDNANW